MASVPSIWPERSTRCGAQSAVGRAKKVSIRMGERYATRPTSVFRAAGRAEVHEGGESTVLTDALALRAALDPLLAVRGSAETGIQVK